MGAFHPTRVKGRRGRCGSWDRLCSERQDPIRRPKNVLGWRVPGNVEYRLWSARLAAPGTARLVCCQCGRAEPVIELVLHRPEVVGSVDAQVRPLRGIDSQEVIGVLVSSLIAEASQSRRRRPWAVPSRNKTIEAKRCLLIQKSDAALEADIVRQPGRDAGAAAGVTADGVLFPGPSASGLLSPGRFQRILGEHEGLGTLRGGPRGSGDGADQFPGTERRDPPAVLGQGPETITDPAHLAPRIRERAARPADQAREVG